MGLESKINFSGKLNDQELVNKYQESDIFVLPSTDSSEAFGIVLLEAMACGLPVIASKLPGVRGVFKDNQEGLLIEPGDVKDLSQKLELLINDQNKRQDMGVRARIKTEKKYSLKKMKESLNETIIKIS